MKNCLNILDIRHVWIKKSKKLCWHISIKTSNQTYLQNSVCTYIITIDIFKKTCYVNITIEFFFIFEHLALQLHWSTLTEQNRTEILHGYIVHCLQTLIHTILYSTSITSGSQLSSTTNFLLFLLLSYQNLNNGYTFR